MMTTLDLQNHIRRDPGHWVVSLMDFVDDVRHAKNPKAFAGPFHSRDEKLNALVAAVVESLCAELRLAPPAWVEKTPASREPWFVSGLQNLKAIALVESPLPFRRRKIFVLENFLQRV